MVGIATADLDQIKKGYNGAKQAFAEGQKTFNDTTIAFSELAKEAVNAAKAEIELTKATQDLEDSQDALAVKTAIAEAAVSKALLTAKDRNKTEKERIALLAQAGKLESETTKEAVKLQEDAYRIALLRALNVTKQRKESDAELAKLNDDQLQRLVDSYHKRELLQDADLKATQTAQIEKIKAESDAANKLQEIANREAALQEQFAARRAAATKAAREAEAKAQADYLARTKTEYDQQVKLTTDFYAQQETQLLESLAKGSLTQSDYEEAVTALKFDALKRQLQDAKDYGRLTAELERKLAQEGIKIAKDALDKRFNDIVASIARENKEKDLEFEDTIKDITQNEAERSLAILQARLNGQISEYEYQKQTLESQLKFQESQLQAAKDHGDKTVEIERAIAETKNGIRNNDLQNAQHIEDAKFQLATTGLAAIGSLLELGAKNASQAAEFAKAIALFQIGIDTAKAISGVIRAASDSSLSVYDFAAQVALGVATVLGNIAQAKQLLTESAEVPKPQFYEGGYTTPGNPHEEANNLGDKPYTYHQSEYIIPAAVLRTQNGATLADAAERLRRAVRGNPSIGGMYNGGLALADGGMAARSISNGRAGNTELVNGLIAAMKGQKLFVSVTDINTVNKSVNANQAKATL